MNDHIEALVNELLTQDIGYEASNLKTMMDRLNGTSFYISHYNLFSVASADTTVLFRRVEVVEDYVLFMSRGVFLVKAVIEPDGKINNSFLSVTPYEINRDWLHLSGCILNGVDDVDGDQELPFHVTMRLDSIIPGDSAHWSEVPAFRGVDTWSATYTVDDGHRVISVSAGVPAGWELTEPKELQLAVIVTAPLGVNRTHLAREIGMSLETHGYEVCYDSLLAPGASEDDYFKSKEIGPLLGEPPLVITISEHGVNKPIDFEPYVKKPEPRVFPPIVRTAGVVNVAVIGRVHTGKSVIMTLINTLLKTEERTVGQVPLGLDVIIPGELAVQLAPQLGPKTRVKLFTQPVSNSESISETLRNVDRPQPNPSIGDFQ